MLVRGAPLIGATAAYGMALAMRADAPTPALERAYTMLIATRPTAINLQWALDEMLRACAAAAGERVEAAYARAVEICRGGCRDQPRDRPARPGADRGDRRDRSPAKRSTS